MCIGFPMRVPQTWADGALVEGRGRVERIDTRLLGACAPGQWVLVFHGAARERLEAARAAEIEATLALLEAGLAGDARGAGADPGFVLPSALGAAEVAALTGQASPAGQASQLGRTPPPAPTPAMEDR